MSSRYDWTWLAKEDTPKKKIESLNTDLDTIPEGSRVVVYGTIPQPLIVRGETIWVYDIELAVMIVKSWSKQGMSREEIEDFLLETR